MSITEREVISSEEAERRGVHGLIDGVRSGRAYLIEVGDNDQVMLVGGPLLDFMEQFAVIEDTISDFHDALLVNARQLADGGARTSIDDVIAKLGFTREEILAEDDD
jgi:hypothetical protein